AYPFLDSSSGSNKVSIDLHVSTGASFTGERWSTNQVSWYGSLGSYATFLRGDLNGDGKTDLLYVHNDGMDTGPTSTTLYLDHYVSTGSSASGFYHPTQQSYAGGWLGGGIYSAYMAFVVGDFNGDGKVDVIKTWNWNSSGYRAASWFGNDSLGP